MNRKRAAQDDPYDLYQLVSRRETDSQCLWRQDRRPVSAILAKLIADIKINR